MQKPYPEGTVLAPLTVHGRFAGKADVAHGAGCVSLTVTGNGVAGVVMTPDEARTLARALLRQADHAEAL